MRKAIALVSCALALGVQAQDRACSKADATAAEKNVDMVVSWTQLQKVWRDYRHCDTGQVSETFTDAVLRLAVEWKNVDALGEAMKDAQFKTFMVKHLKSAAEGDRDAIYSRAKASCPANHTAMCAELAEVVKRPVATAPPEPPQPPSKAEPAKPVGK